MTAAAAHHDVPEMDLLAENLLTSSMRELAIKTSDMPQAVRDAASDFEAAIGDVLGAGRQAARDLAELRSKKDLIPGPGFERLRQEAIAEAQARSSEADRRAERAIGTLKQELISAALPRLEPSREALARQELALALGEAQGDQAVSRAITLAQNGSAEAIAALTGTSFGRTLLSARGVSRVDEELARVRLVAAGSAVKRAHSQREVMAGAALERLGTLGAVKGAAGLYVLHAAELRKR